MRRRIVECVPNFSEGRDPRIVDAIAGVIRSEWGVALLHRTMDPDHNRSVITFAGLPQAVAAAAVRAVVKAAELIDLARHQGVHPRIGATDVVPFIPVEGTTLEECVELAHQAGEQIWAETGIPVYFYEAAATRPDRVRLENVRRGQFEGLREEVRTSANRRPDVGGPELHPSAGACVVGARKLLIAYNVNLATTDVAIASGIARKIRTSSGGFPHVKALGLPLASRSQVQVSMNLTDYEATPPHVVYEAIRREAAHGGVDVAESEFIGLIPRAALEQAAQSALRIEGFHPSAVLENRIAEELPPGIDELFARLADPRSTDTGLTASALAGAMAASMGMALRRATQSEGCPFEALRERFLRVVREHEEFARDAARTLLACVQVAESARSLQQELSRRTEMTQAAAALASAALTGATALVRQKLDASSDAELRTSVEHRMRSLE